VGTVVEPAWVVPVEPVDIEVLSVVLVVVVLLCPVVEAIEVVLRVVWLPEGIEVLVNIDELVMLEVELELVVVVSTGPLTEKKPLKLGLVSESGAPESMILSAKSPPDCGVQVMLPDVPEAVPTAGPWITFWGVPVAMKTVVGPTASLKVITKGVPTVMPEKSELVRMTASAAKALRAVRKARVKRIFVCSEGWCCC